MKNSRHRKILEIIEQYEIETQDELCQRLLEEGFQVTQATVSRDINTLHLYKKNMGDGHQRYAADVQNDHSLNDKFKRVLADGFVSIDTAQNIIVIKTVSGMAMAVAAAIDSLKYPEVVGTIAGDDTIMMAIRTVEDAEIVMDRIESLIV